MKLSIEATQCDKLKIPIDTAFYIASLYLGKLITNQTFQDVCSRGFIEYDGFTRDRIPINPRLTPSGIEAIEDIFLNSEFRDPDSEEDRYDRLAEKMQKLFPKGRKPGTSLMWQDSTVMIARKLRTVVKKYKVNFTDEEALEATKKYVDSFNGDHQFMQVLKYFILKRNNETGEESSQFLSYLQNAGQADESNTDWRDSVR